MKIDAYLKTIANQNPRTARVFGSHLKDFHRFNDGKTDAILEGLRQAKKTISGFLMALSPI